MFHTSGEAKAAVFFRVGEIRDAPIVAPIGVRQLVLSGPAAIAPEFRFAGSPALGNAHLGTIDHITTLVQA